MKRLIVIMGVTGCGKSTLGKVLAQQRNSLFLDADDFHSAQAKQQMQAGIGLTDEQRQPWFNRIHEAINKSCETDEIVLACSALKKDYRHRIRTMAQRVIFIWPNPELHVLQQRLSLREAHFADASLLKSQFEALEVPDNESDVWQFSGSPDFDSLHKQVSVTLERYHDTSQ